jgi:hypothetical protein
MSWNDPTECPIWGARDHFWCVDGEDNVVDPTASQFPSKGTGVYAMNRFYPIELDKQKA